MRLSSWLRFWAWVVANLTLPAMTGSLAGGCVGLFHQYTSQLATIYLAVLMIIAGAGQLIKWFGRRDQQSLFWQLVSYYYDRSALSLRGHLLGLAIMMAGATAGVYYPEVGPIVFFVNILVVMLVN